MRIRYRRTGGRPPADRELLDVEADGTFRMWRSLGGSAAGRFAGRLDEAPHGKLNKAAAEAVAAPVPELSLEPDSAAEQVEIDGARATFGGDVTGAGGWASLVEMLRGLLDALTDSPVAAIALEVAPGSAALVHRGTEPLDVDLEDASVSVSHYGPGTEYKSSWRTELADGSREVASPGWRHELPFDHGFTPASGDRIFASVELTAHEGETPVTVVVRSQAGAPAG